MALLLSKQYAEVLGRNARTLDYIKKGNKPAAIKMANNKLATKRQLQKSAVSTPRLHATISRRSQLRTFRWTKLPSSFVLKPNSSSGGGGIIVIFGRNKKGNWVKADKTEMFIPELKNHIFDILDGNFSLGNVPDSALFEQRIKNHSTFKPLSKKGIPDIRVLVYNLVPIMAMLRLPTEESQGRANLHSGGIGVGIDMAHGLTTTAIYRGQLIETLPHSRISLSGIKIPHWKNVLLTAVTAAKAIGLQYSGVDIAIDREDGPTVLELNARPGLDIQLANLAPLKSRLRRVEGLKVATPEKGVRLSRELFSEEVEQEIEDISGRTLLGVIEPVTILDGTGNEHNFLAKIDTGAFRTTIDEAIVDKLGLHKALLDGKKAVRGALGQESRPMIELTMLLHDHRIKTKAFITDRSHMNYAMIVGRRDLKSFLVDPSKRERVRAKS